MDRKKRRKKGRKMDRKKEGRKEGKLDAGTDLSKNEKAARSCPVECERSIDRRARVVRVKDNSNLLAGGGRTYPQLQRVGILTCLARNEPFGGDEEREREREREEGGGKNRWAHKGTKALGVESNKNGRCAAQKSASKLMDELFNYRRTSCTSSSTCLFTGVQ